MNSETFLHYLQNYGPIALAAVLFLAGMGIPVPAGLLVIAAGAFARQGRFSWALAFAMTLLGAVLGSGGSYLTGRYGLQWLVTRLKRGRAWRKAEDEFQKRGAVAIVLTRFLLTPLALPINLIAGSEKYPFGKFIASCAVGGAIWVGMYGGAGYAAGASWPWIQARIGSYAPWIFMGAAALFGLYELSVHWRGHLPAPPGPEALRASSPSTEG
ncbi:MAG: VTT domain-containing protein [Cytophagales bacterium]|nr:VTT domain-containing protein [Armatimonadota bacterium]